MTQSIVLKSLYFEKVIFDWSILQPDLGLQLTTSIFVCAILCMQRSCATFNAQRTPFMKNDSSEVNLGRCQMSKTKGTCMEKEEVYHHPGSRMYQLKVFRNSVILF
jgi:hypothetical protein